MYRYKFWLDCWVLLSMRIELLVLVLFNYLFRFCQQYTFQQKEEPPCIWPNSENSMQLREVSVKNSRNLRMRTSMHVSQTFCIKLWKKHYVMSSSFTYFLIQVPTFAVARLRRILGITQYKRRNLTCLSMNAQARLSIDSTFLDSRRRTPLNTSCSFDFDQPRCESTPAFSCFIITLIFL